MIFDTAINISPENIQKLITSYNEIFVNKLSLTSELSTTVETIDCIIKNINEIAEYKNN